MTHYSPDYLRRLIEAVEVFQGAFADWSDTQTEAEQFRAFGNGLLPTSWDSPDSDPNKIRELELRVAEAAGPAARAVKLTGAYIEVQGLGLIDPLSNWFMTTTPKAPIYPRDVRLTAATVLGRLKILLDEAAERQKEGFPTFSPANMHPVVWSAAAAHWTTHHYRVAVREASDGLTQHWKVKLNRNDTSDTSFWQQTLSPGDPKPGAPKLRWPGAETDRTAKSMRRGLEDLAKSLAGLASGLNLTVRNTATHSGIEMDEQEAMEQLAAYSFLARHLDKCEVLRAPESFPRGEPGDQGHEAGMSSPS